MRPIAALLLPLALLGAGCQAHGRDPVAACGSTSAAAIALPALSGRVVDQASLLPPELERRIDGDLAGLERRTTDQLVLVTVPSLAGHSIESYSCALANGWGIGRKGVDNGVLVLIAPAERRVRIEVGRGLEGLLTDARAQTIVDGAMLPYLRGGDYAGAAETGVAEIERTLDSDRRRPMPRRQR